MEPLLRLRSGGDRRTPMVEAPKARRSSQARADQDRASDIRRSARRCAETPVPMPDRRRCCVRDRDCKLYARQPLRCCWPPRSRSLPRSARWAARSPPRALLQPASVVPKRRRKPIADATRALQSTIAQLRDRSRRDQVERRCGQQDHERPVHEARGSSTARRPSPRPRAGRVVEAIERLEKRVEVLSPRTRPARSPRRNRRRQRRRRQAAATAGRRGLGSCATSTVARP